ncbi:MAG: nucleotidyltransferase domain-containing protein [Eubacterium sp.]|nr:nucleotidyltransferase domain-containing protein [Eubacterium sp.]
MASKAQIQAQRKYDKENTRQILLKLNLTTDADILKKLDEVDNRQGYIKSLVRRDMRSLSDVLSVDSIRLLLLPAARKYKFSKVFLFGSYARGEATAESDVDLLVEGGTMENMFDYYNTKEALQDAFGKNVDLVMERAAERDNSRSGKRFREKLEREKVLIYAEDK